MEQILNSTTNPNWPGILIKYDRPVELFVDSPLSNSQNNSYKILWVKEGDEISGFKKYVLNNYHSFDAILTYDSDILSRCYNSHFMAFGTSWIEDYNLSDKKVFQISHLTGHKRITRGHIIRQEIHTNQKLINKPIDFYISQHGGVTNKFNNKILEESKNPLFNSQFHICVENSKQNGFFTEKLIDCFITKTIPIYWGCDNIGDFFNTQGFFIANDTIDIIDICNNITEETYLSKIDFINENYNKSIHYSTLLDRLQNTITKILNN